MESIESTWTVSLAFLLLVRRLAHRLELSIVHRHQLAELTLTLEAEPRWIESLAKSFARVLRPSLLPEKGSPMNESTLERMSRIAERFPSLRGLAGVRPFDADTLARASVGRSHGEQLAARYVLQVWNGGQHWEDEGTLRRFDLYEARSVWDAPHKAAFLESVVDDWGFWP